ncbi:diguanylate cyclase/phosphodiesterase (GGDEF & EAL domains) with PAS/PAC sensor(s) [hydrothermal vent metagenome]|uniref:Diguanylate cyclase/phosphodiesterase (GGDEF & EAL domains) with PAS/PAC sensor(S) n=1 Tax=hydrothermal vent metagenome TaxID=652676 RepID=A0A1W1CGZ1_9ZZZZ
MKKLNEISILFVEDDINTQEIIKMLLEDYVGKFYQAFDGEEALEIYYDKKPEIIITDIRMPKLNGLEMAEQIKEFDPNQPIIVMSAFDDKKLLLKAINIGIDQFIKKPMDSNILFEKIEYLVEKMAEKRKIDKILQKKDANLYKMAYYDHLTNVCNRAYFELALEDMIQRTRAKNYLSALFFIDLDNFKTINDTYGHKAGDCALKKVVSNIKKTMRDRDILCRLGGDEFTLIAENMKDIKKVEILAQRIAKATHFTMKYKEVSFEVSCSIGIAVCPDHGVTKEELMESADKAMYSVKKSTKAGFKIQ